MPEKSMISRSNTGDYCDIEPSDLVLHFTLYVNAFIVGFIIMAFEILGSRYLNPFFGSGIFTWSSLITTVLMALSAGYFIGGYIADRKPSVNLLGFIVFSASIWFGLMPIFANPLFAFVFDSIKDIRYGSLISSIFLLFVPLSLLGVYSPFAIRLILRSTHISGTVSGRIYGISTLGSIIGTLVTTFYLIPFIGTRIITYVLFLCTLSCSVSILSFGLYRWRGKIYRTIGSVRSIFVIVLIFLLMPPIAWAISLSDSFFKPADILRFNSILKSINYNLIETVESPYNTIFIHKLGSYITMTFRYDPMQVQSIINLRNEDQLPALYTQVMTVGLVYADNPEHILIMGLGGGMTTRYIRRYFPELTVDAVELDRGVIDLAKEYFGVKESNKYKITESDARVHLKRSKERYSIIMSDAYPNGSIPFHLFTKEFYEIVKGHLEEGGCFVMNLYSTKKLFKSTLSTLNSVFESVDVFTHRSMRNVVIVAYKRPRLTKAYLEDRADNLQREKNFYHDIRRIVRLRRNIKIIQPATLLTDDFAPVNYYNSVSENGRRLRY
jgi:spermidine synthase